MLASASLDKSIKIFDLLNYDMIKLLKLEKPIVACDFLCSTDDE